MPKKVSIGAINITMHPHSPLDYVKLFKDARKMECFSKMSKDKAGLIAKVNYQDKSKGKTSPITGDLYRFSHIDTNGNWFNTLTNQHAEEDELDAVNIPEHLKPNSSRFSYLFFPESHVLFYESYYDGHTLGSQSALKLIEGVLNDERLVKKYGVVDVTIIPCKENLSEALSIPSMNKLTMLIKRPNPDGLKKAEQKVLNRFNAQNIAKYKHELVAVPGISLEPDEDTKTLANIAAKNGSVGVIGRDQQDHPIEYKTENHPWTIAEYYNPKIETAYNTFSNAVFKARQYIESWVEDKDG